MVRIKSQVNTPGGRVGRVTQAWSKRVGGRKTRFVRVYYPETNSGRDFPLSLVSSVR